MSDNDFHGDAQRVDARYAGLGDDSFSKELTDQEKPLSKLALCTIFFGVISLLVCAVPLINSLSFVLSIISVVFAVFAFTATRKNGKKRGRWLMALGFVFAVFAFVVALLMHVLLISEINDVKNKYSHKSNSVEIARVVKLH
ncbi:hypothetical protein ACMZ8B_03735 [Gardnerella greenwoodii]|uniref:hypothetical protein n=1 Tax=Gardnerella greenwoodii TaxID=2914925 RepID=UPI0039EF01AC